MWYFCEDEKVLFIKLLYVLALFGEDSDELEVSEFPVLWYVLECQEWKKKELNPYGFSISAKYAMTVLGIFAFV